MKACAVLLVLTVAAATGAAESTRWATKSLRAGIIGTDTSHVPEFTNLFRLHPEWKIKVVAAFKGGSPDLPDSANRVDRFAALIHDKFGVKFVGSVEELVQVVDVVLLESVDGRPHLAQATPVLRAGKRLFIDKPLAASLEDARRIVQLSQETGTPFFSCSSYRFHPDIPKLRDDPGVGRVSRVQASSEFSKLEFHPDLYFYGIHGVEALYAVMGTGCVSVSRKVENGADITTGQWKDGRTGVYYGSAKGAKVPTIRVWGTEGSIEAYGDGGYEPLLRAMAQFFQTGRPPVNPDETIEIFEFMTAAQRSSEHGGAPVLLAELRK
jgi:predicted dehydrogenase